MLAGIALTVTLAGAQPPASAAYMDAVRAYAPGSEARAVLAVQALRLDDPDDVVDGLDTRLCQSVGASSCHPATLKGLSDQARDRLAAVRRAFFPRALALHVEALAACDPMVDHQPAVVHREIVLRLIARLDAIAGEPGAGEAVRRLPWLGRRLLLWALQYLRHLDGLARALEATEPLAPADLDVGLARGALAELRTLPDAVRAGVAARSMDTPLPRETQLAQEEARRLDVAAKVYESVLAAHPDALEAHLRRARLLLRLGRAEPALHHLHRVAGLGPDARQTYLASLFEADAGERLARRSDAVQAYRRAARAWPGAQAPAIGLARLHALDGDVDAARAALRALDLERPAGAPERTEPWVGYLGAQAWRLPAGIIDLQAALPPLP
jgi:tetratricopeptide (TPR) repeat protein